MNKCSGCEKPAEAECAECKDTLCRDHALVDGDAGTWLTRRIICPMCLRYGKEIA